ncbi:hypothetical protein [Paracoccus niistensis]|uniref:DUF4169 family protein n=1 Tax=Paracoccus niistensis TaxID=632935 RepID=A0ABV6HZ24_9RHOB
MSKDRRPPPSSDSRQARLTAALRANLARRKAQARSRAEGETEGDKAAGLMTGSKNNGPAGKTPDEGASED